MNGATYSVQSTAPPSMLKSMRLTTTGEATSQAIAPETVAAVGETNVSAASGDTIRSRGSEALVSPHRAVAAKSEFFADRSPVTSTASTATRRFVPQLSLENVNVL